MSLFFLLISAMIPPILSTSFAAFSPQEADSLKLNVNEPRFRFLRSLNNGQGDNNIRIPSNTRTDTGSTQNLSPFKFTLLFPSAGSCPNNMIVLNSVQKNLIRDSTELIIYRELLKEYGSAATGGFRKLDLTVTHGEARIIDSAHTGEGNVGTGVLVEFQLAGSARFEYSPPPSRSVLEDVIQGVISSRMAELVDDIEGKAQSLGEIHVCETANHNAALAISSPFVARPTIEQDRYQFPDSSLTEYEIDVDIEDKIGVIPVDNDISGSIGNQNNALNSKDSLQSNDSSQALSQDLNGTKDQPSKQGRTIVIAIIFGALACTLLVVIVTVNSLIRRHKSRGTDEDDRSTEDECSGYGESDYATTGLVEINQNRANIRNDLDPAKTEDSAVIENRNTIQAVLKLGNQQSEKAAPAEFSVCREPSIRRLSLHSGLISQFDVTCDIRDYCEQHDMVVSNPPTSKADTPSIGDKSASIVPELYPIDLHEANISIPKDETSVVPSDVHDDNGAGPSIPGSNSIARKEDIATMVIHKSSRGRCQHRVSEELPQILALRSPESMNVNTASLYRTHSLPTESNHFLSSSALICDDDSSIEKIDRDQDSFCSLDPPLTPTSLRLTIENLNAVQQSFSPSPQSERSEGLYSIMRYSQKGNSVKEGLP